MVFGKDIEKTFGCRLPGRRSDACRGHMCWHKRRHGPWPMVGEAEGLQGQKPCTEHPQLVLRPGSQCPYSKPECPHLSLSVQEWGEQHDDAFVTASPHSVRTLNVHASECKGKAWQEMATRVPGQGQPASLLSG